VIEALDLICVRRATTRLLRCDAEVLSKEWFVGLRDQVIEQVPASTASGGCPTRLCAPRLREKLRCKEIWSRAERYRNPTEDLPQDFAAQRDAYYAALQLPTDAQRSSRPATGPHGALTTFHDAGHEPPGRILTKDKGWIELTRSPPSPTTPARLKGESASAGRDQSVRYAQRGAYGRITR